MPLDADHSDRKQRTGRRRPTLAEPIEVAKFFRNRKGEAVIVSLREYEGHVLVDARVFFTNSEGRFQPTSKGLSVVVRRLPDLAAALVKAEQKARELGLLDEVTP